jgi:outer membrane protein
MKNALRLILPAALLLAFLSGSAFAQTKVATVDLGSVFTNYFKTKLAQAAILDRATQLDKDDKSMKDDFTKASDDYQMLLQQANDQSISADERARRKQSAAEKLKQLEERRAAITQYENQAQGTLNDQRQRMRDKILVDIQAALNAKAKAGGYALVVDRSAQAASLTSVVVYSVPEIDLTADLLKQLNAGAPIDLPTVSPATAVSPAPSLLRTNSP